MKRLIAVVAVVGLLVTGCDIGPFSSTSSPPPGTNRVTPDNQTSPANGTNTGTATPASGGVSNNNQGSGQTGTSQTGGNSGQTNATGQGSAKPPNKSGGQNAQFISTMQQAEGVVKGMFAGQAAADPKLTIQFDHQQTDHGITVWVFHIYDNMKDHTATIDWIQVRADGKVQNGIVEGGWVTPNQYKQQQ